MDIKNTEWKHMEDKTVKQHRLCLQKQQPFNVNGLIHSSRLSMIY